MISRLTQIVADIYAVHGLRLWWLMLLMVIVALGEGLTMALLLPILSVLGVENNDSGGVIHSLVEQIFTAIGVSESVTGTLALIILAFALQASLFVLQTWWVATLQRRYGAFWQKRLFSAFMRAGWSFVAQHKMGEMTNVITQETLRLSGVFMVIASTSTTLAVMLVYLVVSLFLSWQITLALLGLAALLFVAIKGVSRRSFIIGGRISRLNSEQMVLLSEFIGGAKLIKATATEDRAVRDVDELTEELRVNHTWATFLPGLTKGVFEFGSLAALCAILVFGHMYLSVPAGHMILILALFIRLLPRFNLLQQNVQLLNTCLPAYLEVNRLYGEASKKAEMAYIESDDSPAPSGSLCLSVQSAGFQDVRILKDVELEIPEKGFIGIVGESGAGKSTLVHLLLNLCELYEGDVKIGDASIRSVSPTHWRKTIGYVPQETILFHRSVRDNIAWANEDADDEAIISAAKKARAHEFIMDLPKGYETVIGDQGLRLSGGQRQRLGIARALVTQPHFLLLDEATSALDSASEQGVLATLEILRKELCIISVAHRLATVRNADRIVVMDAGAVIETGGWNELIENQGALYHLAQKQHMV